MGMFCLCGYGKKSCGICGAGDGCLAGNGDDDFFLATKEQIIERLDRDQYKNHRDIMIKTLKEKFNYEYADIPEPYKDDFKGLYEHLDKIRHYRENGIKLVIIKKIVMHSAYDIVIMKRLLNVVDYINTEIEHRIEYQNRGLCCQTRNLVMGRCDNCQYLEKIYFNGEEWRCRCENTASHMWSIYVEGNWSCKEFREKGK